MTLKIFASAFFGIVAGLAVLFGGFSYVTDRQAEADRRVAAEAQAACLARMPVTAHFAADRPEAGLCRVEGTVENRCGRPLRAWSLQYERRNRDRSVVSGGSVGYITLPAGATAAWEDSVTCDPSLDITEARVTRVVF